MKMLERENEIIRTIKLLSDSGIEFMVVGGYAVSALSRHRFSVDCDIVIPEGSLEAARKLLKAEGYKKVVRRKGFDRAYGGWFENYKKGAEGFETTIDILVKSLACRDTNAVWGFDYIKKHSIQATMSGIESSAVCMVPEKELLAAMKLHVSRMADVRDFVMLATDMELEKLLGHIRKGDTDLLKKQLENAMKYLEDEKIVNSIKGVFELTAEIEKYIAKAKNIIEDIKSKL